MKVTNRRSRTRRLFWVRCPDSSSHLEESRRSTPASFGVFLCMTDRIDSGTQRFALGIEYDGGAFHGWQVQPRQRTVQACVERALAHVADAQVPTICAGRTDAGVHALGQVVHFDSPVGRPPEAFVHGTNTHLPDDVRVIYAVPVASDFHARFGALSRTYRYLILNRAQPSVLARAWACWERRPLDIVAMNEAASALVGEHDFSAFRAAGCQAPNAVRTVERLVVSASGPWVTVEITANAFLQNMVRIVVGSLMRVGIGDAEPAWLGQALQGRNRAHRGQTAPPQGLYFAHVRYESRFQLPYDVDGAALSPVSSIIMAQ